MPIGRENVFRMIKNGRIAVILGGDVPLYKGMRTNIEIMRDLIERSNYPQGFPRSLAEVGEYFAELHGASQLVERVVRLVDTKPGDSNLLKSLAKIKTITEIFCLTMDEHIQNYFPREDVVVIRSDMDVPRIYSRSRRLYRLNGTINNAHAMILTRTRLLERLSLGSKSPLVAQLISNLTSRQFLIIGHDLREWNFSFYFEQVTSQLSEFREKAILFCDHLDPVLVQHWAKKNIEVTREDPVGFLEEYLEWEKKRQ